MKREIAFENIFLGVDQVRVEAVAGSYGYRPCASISRNGPHQPEFRPSYGHFELGLSNRNQLRDSDLLRFGPEYSSI